MPWCPKCGTEYRQGFETCADCGETLVSDEPEVAREKAHRGSWVIADIVLAVVLTALAHFLALISTVLMRGVDDCVMIAVFLGVLWTGGICLAVFRPMLRLGLCFAIWAVAPAIVFAVALVDMVRAPHFQLRYLLDWDTVGVVACYLLVSSGIGAVTTTVASRWVLGEGRRNALALLAMLAAFVSTPFAMSWLAARFYR